MTAQDVAPRAHTDVAAAPPGTALLQCRGVEVAYDKLQVLFGVDLEVHEGEIVVLLGTNGAGKSTLLKAVSGLLTPIGGSIVFDGHDITHADPVTCARLGIVQVPGGKAVFPTLTVAEHFTAASWLLHGVPAAEIDARVEQVLGLFPRLRARFDQMAGNLSGGEQQQLGIGMAFLARPRLLIVDELSLGLSPLIVGQLLDFVRAMHDEGTTILLIEQSINVALTVASRAYFMEKGEVRFSGATADLLERDDIVRSVFLGRASTRAAARITEPVPADDRPALEVDRLTLRFGGLVAVRDVSFAVTPGQILGIIGPNGAGKTTIFDLVSGHLAADSGRVLLDGEDVSSWPAHRRAAAGLGRSFQDARIFPSLSVAENIAVGLERHIEVRDHVSALFGTPAIRASEDDVSYTVDDLIELMELQAYRDMLVSELSTGTRRIVDLAMVLAHDPSVLLLDEPSSGIAQRETEALGPLLRRIRDETGCAMLVIEHDMPLVMGLADEILVLELGSVLLRDRPDVVVRDPQVISSYLGGDVGSIQRSGRTQPRRRAARARKATP